MTKVRFAVFGLILTGGVALAVSSLLAQPAEAPRRAEPWERAWVMSMDGPGSWIGVTVEDLTTDDLKGLSEVTSGVRIERVDEDSPAAKAGLRSGDVVVEYDGERVRSARQFARLVQETVGGRPVRLAIVRDGQRQMVDVTPRLRSDLFSWQGEIERSMRGLEPRLREIEPKLRELEPRLREFRVDPPDFNFDFGGVFPWSTRGRLGVEIESLSPQLAEYFGVKDGGVLVSSVTQDSPAGKAGLRAGDVIVSIDGDRVRDYDDLTRELRDKTGEITIGIVRDRKESTIKATLEERRARTLRLRRAA